MEYIGGILSLLIKTDFYVYSQNVHFMFVARSMKFGYIIVKESCMIP